MLKVNMFIKYDGGGFWLYLDDLEGYFKFDNGVGYLQIIFKDAEQEKLYDRIWDQIINNIDNNKTIKDIKKIKLNSDELPLGLKFKIKNITIVIKAKVIKDINEGIDVNKNKLVSKECIICNYWYFINRNFNDQRY